MGVLYRAHDPGLDREVAIKVLQPGASPVRRERFAREAHALCTLQHPHIVPIHSAGEHEGEPYLVMAYIDGESLEQRLARGVLPVEEAIYLTGKLAGAIDYAHAKGILHRDLKPANVLLTRAGVPLLTDFGIARLLDPSSPKLSATGAYLGTPGFSPSEQVEGGAVGPATDVYGLAATLYAMLTGVPPYQGSTLIEVAEAVGRPPRPPSQLRPQVPPALDRALLRALDPDPRRRYPTANAFAQALEQASRGAVGSRGAAAGVVLAGLGAAGALLILSASPTPAPRGAASVSASASHSPAASPVATTPPRESPLATAPVEIPLVDFGTDLDAAAAHYERLLDEASLGSPHHAAVAQALVERALAPRAGRHLLNEEPLRAIDDYERCVALQPENWQLYTSLAVVRERLGDRPGALRELDRGARAAPDAAPIYQRRAELRYEARDLDGALTDFRRAIHLDPDNANVWFNLGLLLDELRDPEGAHDAYTRSIELDDTHAAAYTNRGIARGALGRLPGGRDDLDRAVELSRDDHAVLSARAMFRMRYQGDLAGALEDFDRSLQLEPNQIDARFDRARLKAQLGDHASALTDLRRVLRELPADSPGRATVEQGIANCERKLRDGR
jgi:serine/threonine-protein kinase